MIIDQSTPEHRMMSLAEGSQIFLGVAVASAIVFTIFIIYRDWRSTKDATLNVDVEACLTGQLVIEVCGINFT